MSKIKINGSGDKYDGLYIKTIDKHNSKIDFTKDIKEAYDRASGFYVESEIEFLKFHFIDEYPCLAYAQEYYD